MGPKRNPGLWPGLLEVGWFRSLEQVPEELVVDLVVVLHFRRLDEGAQQARAAVGRGLLQVGVAALDVVAEQLAWSTRLALKLSMAS